MAAQIDAASDKADNVWSDRYCEPVWQAERDLAMTPAPSIAAAIFKATMIEIEEVTYDTRFDADAMDVLHADFARLAGEA